MVATNQGDTVWVADLQGQEQEEGLDAVEAAVNEVAHEEVACVGTLAALAKQLDQVVELAVDVAAHLLRPAATSLASQ